MDLFTKAGKCIFFSKCGCIPGSATEKIFKRCIFMHSESTISSWEYLRDKFEDKFGFPRKSTKRATRERCDTNYAEPETIRIPVHSDTSNEVWSPGCRGRPDNKRF